MAARLKIGKWKWSAKKRGRKESNARAKNTPKNAQSTEAGTEETEAIAQLIVTSQRYYSALQLSNVIVLKSFCVMV